MDRLENSVNSRLGLFVEDCEIYFDPRSGVGIVLSGRGESLMVTLDMVLG